MFSLLVNQINRHKLFFLGQLEQLSQNNTHGGCVPFKDFVACTKNKCINYLLILSVNGKKIFDITLTH